MLFRGACRLEINAVEREFGFQLLDFGRRSGRRRWRRGLHFHHSGGGGGERRKTIIVYVASDGDAAGLRALGIQRRSGAISGDVTRTCRIAVNEPSTIRAAGGRSDT